MRNRREATVSTRTVTTKEAVGKRLWAQQRWWIGRSLSGLMFWRVERKANRECTNMYTIIYFFQRGRQKEIYEKDLGIWKMQFESVTQFHLLLANQHSLFCTTAPLPSHAKVLWAWQQNLLWVPLPSWILSVPTEFACSSLVLLKTFLVISIQFGHTYVRAMHP